jgi:DNA-binding GntR family transcriptional regulator
MDLTEATGLAPNTVRRAIKVLADEGLVVTEPGRGTFVAEKA